MTAGDTWGTTVNLRYGNYPTYDVTIGRDQAHGFYSTATASDKTWLDGIPDGITVYTEYQEGDRHIKVTIPANTIASMTEGFRLNVNYKIRSSSGDVEQWNYGIDVNCINLDDISTDVCQRLGVRWDSFLYRKSGDRHAAECRQDFGR